MQLNKSNTNDKAFIKYKYKNKNYKNITSLKDLKTEENILNLNIYKKTRNNHKFSSSYSKKKYKNKTRKNYSLSSNKNKPISKDKNIKDMKLQTNRIINEKKENKDRNNKSIDLYKKNKESIIIIEEDKKDEIDFDSPEELHYFMVKLSLNYRDLTENY